MQLQYSPYPFSPIWKNVGFSYQHWTLLSCFQCKLTRQIREVWCHKNSNLWNYGISKHIQKEQDEKRPLAKIQPVSVVSEWGDISNFEFWRLHINPSKTGLDRNYPHYLNKRKAGFPYPHRTVCPCFQVKLTQTIKFTSKANVSLYRVTKFFLYFLSTV